MYKYVIFDVDGTILNGTNGILNSLKKTIKSFNIVLPDDSILEKFIGPPIQQSCRCLLNLDENISQEFTNLFRKELIKKDIYNASIYNGIFELLKLLKTKNIKLGVATYKREDLVIAIAKHFGFDKYFTSICGADNENKLKKIDILKNCMCELGAEKESTILIGDSYHDGAAAKELGIGFIGVTYGFGFKTKDEALEYNPILVADKVEEIINYLKKEKICV